jgi:hypothetical protein
MNRKTGILISAAAICLGVGNSSAGQQIDGTLNFGSDTEVSLTPAGTTDFALATGVHFEAGAGPGGANAFATGVTAGSVLDSIVNAGDWFTFSDFSMNASAVNGIWTGPGGLSFDLAAGGVKSVSGTGNSLTYEGAGTLHASGFDDTEGYLTFTTQKTPIEGIVHFSFSAVTAGNPKTGPNDIPDGGATATLLGLGVIALGSMANRRSR